MKIFLHLSILGILTSLTVKPGTQNPGGRYQPVSGQVVADATGKPIASAHVYIIHGEEEALTNNRGEFRIQTNSQFPLVLYVEREGYKKFQETIEAASQHPVIRLKSN